MHGEIKKHDRHVYKQLPVRENGMSDIHIECSIQIWRASELHTYWMTVIDKIQRWIKCDVMYQRLSLVSVQDDNITSWIKLFVFNRSPICLNKSFFMQVNLWSLIYKMLTKHLGNSFIKERMIDKIMRFFIS